MLWEVNQTRDPETTMKPLTKSRSRRAFTWASMRLLKPNGSMPVELGRRPPIPCVIQPTPPWQTTGKGLPKERSPLTNTPRTHGAFTTCTATFGNGAPIGTGIIRILRWSPPPVRLRARIESGAGAHGGGGDTFMRSAKRFSHNPDKKVTILSFRICF